MKAGRSHDLIVNKWGARFLGRQFACSVGQSGISKTKREGDGATPAGTWHLTGGGWRADRLCEPVTSLPMQPMGPAHVWSDDPAHHGYNQISSAFSPSFRHERMRRGDVLYDVVLFSDWNTEPAEPGRGSAIFVHCWKGARRPTAGCIAFARPDLLWIMARWQADARIIVQP